MYILQEGCDSIFRMQKSELRCCWDEANGVFFYELKSCLLFPDGFKNAARATENEIQNQEKFYVGTKPTPTAAHPLGRERPAPSRILTIRPGAAAHGARSKSGFSRAGNARGAAWPAATRRSSTAETGSVVFTAARMATGRGRGRTGQCDRRVSRAATDARGTGRAAASGVPCPPATGSGGVPRVASRPNRRTGVAGVDTEQNGQGIGR